MKNVQDAFPLSPMQQGMLFHTVYAQTPGMYLEQVRATLEGEVELARLRAAWQKVVDRHSILRTAIVWERLDEPLQVVRKKVTLPWSEHDLSSEEGREQDLALGRILQADRERGFELARAPLMRCTVVRRGKGRCDLIWTYHHIILDGWCSSIIVGEVFQIYRALGRGSEPVLEEPRPYREYISWLSRQDRGGAEAYWREVLRGFSEPTELRLEQGRGGGRADYGSMGEYAEHGLTLSPGLAEEVRGLARSHRLTLNTVIQGAWALVLSRYAGTEDVVFGTTVSGRPPHLRGVESMLGLFVNTLPVRARIAPEETLLPWLEGLQAQTVDRDEYAYTSLVDIQSWVGLPPGAPLFDTVVAFENYPVDEKAMEAAPGLKIADSRVSMEETNYPLVLQVIPEPGLALRALYDSRRYPGDAIARLCRHLATVLESFVHRPEQRVAQVSLLTEGELGQLRREWAAAPGPPARDRPLHEKFEAVAAQRPEGVAVTAPDREMTYGELNRRANQLARYLVSLGVGPEVLVGLCIDRSATLLVALLGILKAGGAYLPLDPRHPGSRLAYVLEDAGAPLIVTTSEVAAGLPEQGARVLTLDDLGQELDGLSGADLGVEVSPDTLAYVIYTSGSTGRPKGSQITHRNVSRLFSCTQPRFRFNAEDVWTLFHTVAFDFSVWEIWGAFLYGGRLVVVPHTVSRSPDEFLELLASEGVTVLNQTPSAFRQLIHADGELSPPAPLALRWVIFGGERLELASLKPWFHRRGDEEPQLVNMYGITETTVHVTWKFLRRSDLEASGSLIGEPIPDLRVAILDQRGMPLPLGVAGELCVAGPGLSRGYLNREELTRERFIQSPFPDPAGETLYRSGDLARLLPDGGLEYLGRMDQQVKVRGFRIELGEIEGVLTEHPGVRDSVVLARTRDPGGEGATELVAYAVPGPDPETLSAPGDAGSDPFSSDGEHGLQSGIVHRWQRVFDDSYRRGEAERDVAFDITGWNSSYTGKAMGAHEMREWVEGTVERILEMGPRRVLEIGCGTGLLLGRIGPYCEEYVATDFSAEAVGSVERLLSRVPELDQVRLLHRAADDFEGLEAGGFDTVILNSVAQYFPDADYLARVVEGALGLLEPGGGLFIGDLRSKALLTPFHASVEFHRAPAATTLGQLRQRILEREGREGELVLDPRFFPALGNRLGNVALVTAGLKRGRFRNEMTLFRYDVVIRKGENGGAWEVPEPEWLPGSPGASVLSRVRARLESDHPARLGIHRVPNARLGVEAELSRRLQDLGRNPTVAALRTRLAGTGGGAVDPEALWELGEELGYRVVMGPSTEDPFSFDAVFLDGKEGPPGALLPVPVQAKGVGGERPWAGWANDPARRFRFQYLAEELRRYLRDLLPDHMLPAHVVLLDALPLTANGKVDIQALPEPEVPARSVEADDRPHSATEEILAGIWADVLGVASVGRNDDFFDLGGHSLMATQVISRVRSAFGVEVPMRLLFASPTVAAFAEDMETRRRDEGPASGGPSLESGLAGDHPPLSFAQQRLWFLDQLEGGAVATYNVPMAFRLRGPLDLEALALSLERVVHRHQSLRTTFRVEDGTPFQRVAPPSPVPVALVDLTEMEEECREAEAMGRMGADARLPFDLSVDPLIRATAYRVGRGEHLLLLCMHHICSDGWSTGVLLNELGHFYGALSQGREPEPLPELPIQYADYAVWQRQWLSGERLEAQLHYWRGRLEGIRETVDFPTDRPRPPVLGFRGRSVRFALGRDLTGRLRRLSQRSGATLYMTLLAGFGALLHRYSGADRLVVGTPVANRHRKEVEPLIGFFVNTLALDLDCSGDPSFRVFLERVRGTALGAYDHQDLPFELLVEELQPRRDLGHNPLFQTMFVLQNATADPPRMAGLSTGGLELDLGISKFDLTMSLEEERDGLAGELQYSSDLFEEATARRIVGHYRRLLEGAAEGAGSRLWQLPLLDEAERSRLTSSFSGAADGGGENGLGPFHEEFVRWAADDPGRPAVIWKTGELSYGELDRRAEVLAAVLRGGGVGPETLVPVCVDRGPEWVVAILAVAKAGGAFVALDPAYPDKRLGYMVSDTGASLLVTQEIHRARLEDTGARMVLVESPGEPPHGDPGTAPAAPGHAAYVVYTSGSTGGPKGVLVTHNSLSNLIEGQVERIPTGPGDRVLQFVSPSFDVALADLGMALTTGAALCVASTEELLPGPGLVDLLEGLRVTHLAIPGSALAAVPEALLPDLRVVMVGGEVCSPDVVARWAPGRQMVNCYGPTEATICATMAHLQDTRDNLNIGRPLKNVTAYVLDTHGQVAPLGVPGELYIGGRGIARGYLGEAAKREGRFVPDPFHLAGGARLFRTGDRARFRADGTLEFLGRMDRQLKIRGYRIEPEEIEAILREHPDVDQAAVFTVEGGEEDPQLAACVTARGDGDFQPTEVRSHLRSRLPRFMLPSRVFGLPALPLTPNGKVDRQALRRELARVEEEGPPPSRRMTDEELRMARIWGDVLGRSRIGPDESFFDAGGHSLAAMRVLARVQEELGVEVPVRVLFESSTLADFTGAVEDRKGREGGGPVLRRRKRRGIQRPSGGGNDPS